MVAYPSLDVYEELMLWIFRNREHIICGHCLKYVRAEWEWSEEVSEKVVEQFFLTHQGCYSDDSVEIMVVEE